MAITPESLQEDIERIQRIAIVPLMLEVICRNTGMGFAAIARVTEDRWIACSVRDEINFGLQPGGELDIETTICNEIRQSRQGVVIDHVSADPDFCNHHTPRQYGFQSYISIPIVLNNGEFFGTLCAIDPKPTLLSDVKTTGMFNLFAQLIAFHLQTMDMLQRSHEGFIAAHEQLNAIEKENRRYEHLTYHSLREPVRKISLFSDILVQEAHGDNLEKVRNTASQIRRFSLDLAGMLRQLSDKQN